MLFFKAHMQAKFDNTLTHLTNKPCTDATHLLNLSNTATADMWEQLFGHLDKKAHMKAMFELTTRMNSLARIVVGPANISATTALQVGWLGI